VNVVRTAAKRDVEIQGLFENVQYALALYENTSGVEEGLVQDLSDLSDSLETIMRHPCAQMDDMLNVTLDSLQGLIFTYRTAFTESKLVKQNEAFAKIETALHGVTDWQNTRTVHPHYMSLAAAN